MTRRPRMHHHGIDHAAVLHDCAVLDHCLDGGGRQVTALQQRQGQVFGQALVGSGAAQQLGRLLLDQCRKIGLRGAHGMRVLRMPSHAELWKVYDNPSPVLNFIAPLCPSPFSFVCFVVGFRFLSASRFRRAIASAPITGSVFPKLTATCARPLRNRPTNACLTSAEFCKTPPAIATRTRCSAGHSRGITIRASSASSDPARIKISLAKTSPCSAAYSTAGTS